MADSCASKGASVYYRLNCSRIFRLLGMGEEDDRTCEPKDKKTWVYFNAQSSNFLILLQKKNVNVYSCIRN